MNTQRRRRWAALAGAVVLTGTTFGPAAAPVGAATDNTERRTTTRTADGMVVETITRGDETVTSYGGAGAQVEWLPTVANEAQVGVAAPPRPSSSSGARGTSDVAPTVYEMSLASGMSPAEACEFARDMDDRGCRTSSQVRSDDERPTDGEPAPRASNIYDAWCYDFREDRGDGYKTSHNCVTRFLDYSNSTHVWLAAKMKSTGQTHDPGAYHDRLKGVGVQLRYGNENSYAVDWAPVDTNPVGSCNTTDVSVEGRRGVTYSSSSTICPERLGPWAADDFQWFGSRWTSGEEAPEDESRGTVATSLQQFRKGHGGTGAGLYAWLRWS